MYFLTVEQVSFIEKEIDQDEITYSHLKYDLIDHVCCEIEEQMNNGMTFYDAYKKILKQPGFKGFKRIQTDTLSLIDKNYRIMRNMMKMGGMSALIILGFATVFKIMHWPGAGIMLIVGFFLLCFLFFPTTILVMNKESKMRGKQLVFSTAFFGGITFMLGTLFKVQHWPGAGPLLMFGNVMLLFLFIPSVLYLKISGTPDRKKRLIYLLGALSLIIFLCGTFFKMFHWPGASLLILIGSVSLITVFLPIYSYRKYSTTGFVDSSFIYIIIVLMYFVLFETLISLNVSNNILTDYINTAKIKTRSTKLMNELNQENYNLLEKDTTINQEKLTVLRKNTDDMYNYIHELKLLLINNTEKAKNIVERIEYLSTKTERKIPDAIMLGRIGKASELKEKIEKQREIFIDFIGDDQAVNSSILKLLNTEIPEYKKHFKSWEEANFQNNMLFNDIAILSHIQHNIRIAENLALNSLLN